MGFLPSFLDKIKSRVTISEIVGRRVELQQSGRDWKGASPFSDEISSSLIVNDARGVFHDASSGERGDAFDFIMAFEKISYDQAVERVAIEVGFTPAEVAGQREPEQYRSPSDVRRWLDRQGSEASLAYSTRTALRAVPFLLALSASKRDVSEGIESTTLLTLRANAIAWAASRFQQQRRILKEFAQSAHEDLLRAGQEWHLERPANVAVGRAAAAAARAWMSSGRSSKNAVNDLEESFVAGAANVFASLEFEGAITDVAEMEKLGGVNDLISRPLWLQGTPRAIQNEWDELESGLLAINKDWFIWTEWYNARLLGSPAQEQIEVKRCSLPRGVWFDKPSVALTKIIEAVSSDGAPSNLLQPLEDIPSPFSFGVSDAGRVSLAASLSNAAQLPYRNSKREHIDRLNACHGLAQDIIGELEAGNFQVRSQYAQSLKKYVARLPTDVERGNFLLADAQARTLRNLFAADAWMLSVGFSAQLKTFLEQHMGLRVFYPDVESFYRDVQNGRLIEPLPLDAIEGFLGGVRDNTPSVFEPDVETAINGSREYEIISTAVDASDQPNLDADQPLPPRDPLGEVDPHAASDFTFAGAANGIWKAFLQGEKIHKAMEGWAKAREALSPHVGEILSWLHRFISANDGSPPMPPST